MQMTTEKKSKSDNKKSIELMTALYKKHYDEYHTTHHYKFPSLTIHLVEIHAQLLIHF